MKKRTILNEQEAIEYLEKATTKWKGLRSHCDLLFQSIDILLAKVKGGVKVKKIGFVEFLKQRDMDLHDWQLLPESEQTAIVKEYKRKHGKFKL